MLPGTVFSQAVTEKAAIRQPGSGSLAIGVRDTYLAAAREYGARELPIGIFDSGTGGLAVLEAILQLDEFNNASHAHQPAGDGRPDFADERVVFLADQANMPYGNYPAVGKKPFLVELIVNDAVFLLGRDYARAAHDTVLAHDKRPAKSVVIACNTATAHGKCDIESLIDLAEIDVQVVNVIDAGAQGAVDVLRPMRGGTVGVLATVGTVSSGAYPAAIQRWAEPHHFERLHVVQQGSLGLAGAIDELPDFVQRNAESPRAGYRGPSLSHATARIERAFLPRYDFDFTAGRMLWEGEPDNPRALQINSAENYVAYEMVSLLETLRQEPAAGPLAVVVLGCTHFPYCLSEFQRELQRLRDYQENGQFIYRPLIAPDVQWIDPAEITARQLYERLAQQQQLRTGADSTAGGRGEFFVTVPNRLHGGVQLDASGGFTYEYKYGRNAGVNFQDVRVIPLTQQYFDSHTAQRLQQHLPCVWRMLHEFSTHQKEPVR
jgi:glutamate racemase